MSKVKDILLKVKALFDAPVMPAVPVVAADPAAPTAQTYKTKDGIEVSIAIKDPAVTVEPSIGDMVTIGNIPAAEGEMELEDGTKLQIDAMGMISGITPIEPATQPDFEAPIEAGPSLEDRIKAIEEKVNTPVITERASYASEDQFKEVEGRLKKQDEVIKGLFELVEEMSKEPSAEPKTLTGAKKEKFDRVNKKELALQGIADALKKIKENK